MDTTAISDEIHSVRKQLAELEERRSQLPEDAFADRAELKDEEHRLEARLGELRELASKAGAGIAERSASAQTDRTRTPNLPPT
ncbi:MAG TPA: hypothetical protein VF115_11285 [Acidimicrobiia bacterium]